MKKIILYCFAFIIVLQVKINAQEQVQGMKQMFDITMDELGNAKVEVSMKLNASQWDMFKRNIGNNTSILKREIEKALPKYFLSDFNYSEDQMERTYTLKFNAKGLAVINEDGQWVAKLETKNPDVTKLSDREFIINADMVFDGVFVKQTQKVHLPSSATDGKIDKDSFGNAILTYTTGDGIQSNWMFFAGIALMLGGGGLWYKNQRPAKPKMKVAKESMAA